jgi:hypothetical protein
LSVCLFHLVQLCSSVNFHLNRHPAIHSVRFSTPPPPHPPSSYQILLLLLLLSLLLLLLLYTYHAILDLLYIRQSRSRISITPIHNELRSTRINRKFRSQGRYAERWTRVYCTFQYEGANYNFNNIIQIKTVNKTIFIIKI